MSNSLKRKRKLVTLAAVEKVFIFAAIALAAAAFFSSASSILRAL